jgi:ribosomal protein S12 methylthiotransferase
MARTLKVVTLGCSKNTVDTEHLLAALPADAFSIVDGEQPSDILLLNTCGFIGDAKEESVNAILAAVEAKKRGEAGEVVVFGCLSQRYPDELRAEIPEVDAWFGARDLAPVLRYLGVKPGPLTGRYMPHPQGYAYLKISEGCDRRCSYCAIPFIRGAHRSVPMEELMAEATELAARGVKELILIAQDTTYYGLDLYHRRALGELLEKLSAIPGIVWIRIHYSYPADFPEDVLQAMADNPKVCRYLDIPLQHIADGMLERMHRHVDGAWTRRLIARLRAEVPGVALRTTMIVGHPGETEAEFEELLDFVREARFERLGAFTYSEEDGTWGAEHLKDDVPEEVKRARLDRLMELQREISLACNQARVGSECLVIVDDFLPGAEVFQTGSPEISDFWGAETGGPELFSGQVCRKTNSGSAFSAPGMAVCRSEFESPEVDGEILLRNPSPDLRVGDMVRVRIVAAEDYDLIAEAM